MLNTPRQKFAWAITIFLVPIICIVADSIYWTNRPHAPAAPPVSWPVAFLLALGGLLAFAAWIGSIMWLLGKAIEEYDD